jgi:hypothetical protein
MNVTEKRIAGAIKSILARDMNGKLLGLGKQISRTGVGMWSGVKMLESSEGSQGYPRLIKNTA